MPARQGSSTVRITAMVREERLENNPSNELLSSSLQFYQSTCRACLFLFSILIGKVWEELFHDKLRIVAGFPDGCFRPLEIGGLEGGHAPHPSCSARSACSPSHFVDPAGTL